MKRACVSFEDMVVAFDQIPLFIFLWKVACRAAAAPCGPRLSPKNLGLVRAGPVALRTSNEVKSKRRNDNDLIGDTEGGDGWGPPRFGRSVEWEPRVERCWKEEVTLPALALPYAKARRSTSWPGRGQPLGRPACASHSTQGVSSPQIGQPHPTCPAWPPTTWSNVTQRWTSLAP